MVVKIVAHPAIAFMIFPKRVHPPKELPCIKDTELIFKTEADSILLIPSTSKAATDSLSGNNNMHNCFWLPI
ncbi:hypothetical protein Trydic_g17570 [Trypoxylus dichotomus]